MKLLLSATMFALVLSSSGDSQDPTRVKLTKLLEAAQEQKASGEKAKARAQGELSKAEAILAKAKEDPDDPDHKKIIEELGPSAIRKAKSNLEKAERLIAVAETRIKLTRRAIENLPKEDAMDRLEHKALDWLFEEAGKSVDDQFSKTGFVADHRKVHELRGIADKLRAVSFRPENEITIKIVKGNSINRLAGASLTTIYIEKAYLDKNPSTDELMFVMGHELAHAQLYHSPKQGLRLLGEEALKWIKTADVTDSFAKKAAEKAAEVLATNQHARAQEVEADLLGAQFALAAGGSSAGIGDCLRRVETIENERMQGLSEAERKARAARSDHPSIEERRKMLGELLGRTF